MAKDTVFSTKKTLNINGSLLDLSRPIVMGILNVTPDSFYDGSQYNSDKIISEHTLKMLSEGAKIIDVGGYSSRPGAEVVSINEEIKRVTRAIDSIIKEVPTAIISIDTFNAEVAKAAMLSGASIINDISAGELDPQMFPLVVDLKAPYIMMHMKGNPKNMQTLTSYDNIISEMMDYFISKVKYLQSHGVPDIIIDPGFGFAKTKEQNFEILQKLSYFKGLGLPLLVGVSRKSMIYKTLETTVDKALNGTSVLNTIALMNGAQILRVHDVKEAVECIQLYKTTFN